MPNIFSSGPGRVAQLTGGGLPMALAIGDIADPDLYAAWRGFSSFKSVITSLSLQSQSGVQFLHTLGQYVYIYTFGERVGDLTVSGLTFMSSCTDVPTVPSTMVTGFEHVVAFYNANRISTAGTPLAICIGTTIAIFAFLLGVKADIVDPSTGLGQFVMTFRFPPTNIISVDGEFIVTDTTAELATSIITTDNIATLGGRGGSSTSGGSTGGNGNSNGNGGGASGSGGGGLGGGIEEA